MADQFLAYSSSLWSITCTVASLVTATARQSSVIVNSWNFPDCELFVAVKLQTGTPASDKLVNVWFYASVQNSLYDDNATGSDAALTMRSPTNLRGPVVIQVPDSGGLTYNKVIPSVAAIFDGKMPQYWGVVIENRSNITFDATESNHIKQWRGVYATVT